MQNNDQEYREFKRKRRVCCCFERRRTCIVTFVTMLILLGVGLYFVFPSLPQVNVSDPYIPPNSKGLLVNNVSVSQQNAQTLLSQQQINLAFDTATNVSVYSPSYINIGIRNISVNLQVKDLSGKVIPTFQGNGFVSNIRFPTRATTEFVLPITLTYMVATLDAGTDPVIQVFISKCLNGNKKLDTVIHLNLEVSAVSWLGIHPAFSFDLQQPCPDISQFAQLIGKSV
ncbi:hypothetical protein HK103_004184 [Boothiomyces macroporosus]|uniref:Late embryogenesis abundant protein LEA-2 subgroup domain-containing protein n=1 Tax=Boothiomyces macroporosus TaxID=261099 RepID=A0AAD5UJW4_9FUNG|nr:hypothetical protein HK103_004184 [Boothiomyces macroporosus]